MASEFFDNSGCWLLVAANKGMDSPEISAPAPNWFIKLRRFILNFEGRITRTSHKVRQTHSSTYDWQLL
jgi:hypothetical protein